MDQTSKRNLDRFNGSKVNMFDRVKGSHLVDRPKNQPIGPALGPTKVGPARPMWGSRPKEASRLPWVVARSVVGLPTPTSLSQWLPLQDSYKWGLFGSRENKREERKKEEKKKEKRGLEQNKLETSSSSFKKLSRSVI